MDDTKTVLIFEQLAETLQAHDLGWVVDQINEQLAQGKTEQVKISIYKEVSVEEPTKEQMHLFDGQDVKKSLKPSTKQERMVIFEYSPQERLRLLVEAVKNVVSQTTELEEHVTKFYNGDVLGEPQRDIDANIIFYSEQSTDTDPFIFSKNNVGKSREFTDKLKPLLEKLLETI